MDFNKVKLYISSQRIDRYLVATKNRPAQAVKLYNANLQVAQAFHPLLGLLEVILRNQINATLTTYFVDPDWIINQKKGFMVHPSLTHKDKKTGHLVHNHFLKKEIEKIERRIAATGMHATSNKIISELMFGFWTDLFEVHHYKNLAGRPIHAFSNLPSGFGRKDILDTLNKIRAFRNRINHNEPICFLLNDIDFARTKEVYDSIYDVIRWIDPELEKWFSKLDRVELKIRSAKRFGWIDEVAYFMRQKLGK